MGEIIIYDKIIDRGILYDFKPYDSPRLASYESDIDEYEFPKGWLTKPVSVLVIGETDDSFITELSATEHGEWTDERILFKYVLPLGFHKSRFIKWEETQLEMF